MGRADLHIHPSDDPDVVDSSLAFYAALLASDLDVAVLADHDRIAVATELAQRAREERAPIELIVGEEITSRRGHVLGIGLTAVVPAFLSLAETIAAVHEQGAIAVVAHPLLPIWTSASEVAVVALAEGDPRSRPDALEAMHPTAAWFPRWRRRVGRLAERTGTAVVGGSDAHAVRSIGRGWTEFDGATAADLYAAIRSGTTRAGGTRTPLRDLLWVERSSRASSRRRDGPGRQANGRARPIPWHDRGVIDRSGKWWKGQSFEALVEYLRLYTQDGYPVSRVVQSECVCGARVFRLHADPDEGVARRSCIACGTKAFIGDTEEFWEEASPRLVKCPCGKNEYDVGVGFSLRDGGEVKWMTVGNRCVACGILAACADWKIDYGPTDHLFAKA